MKKVFFYLTMVIFITSCSDNIPSEKIIKSSINEFINNNKEFYLDNGYPYCDSEISIESWKGIFQNNENEIQVKTIISYYNCDRKKKKEQQNLNFLFNKNLDKQWTLSSLDFGSKNKFRSVPYDLVNWYKKVKTKTFIIK